MGETAKSYLTFIDEHTLAYKYRGLWQMVLEQLISTVNVFMYFY